MPGKPPRVRELDKVGFHFESRVEIMWCMKAGCRGEEDYLNIVLIWFDLKGVLQCHHCSGAKMPLCYHEDHWVIQVLWAPGHYMPSKGSLHRNLSVLTVPCPFLWEKGKALYQRQQKKLSPSGVRTVMTHCPSISRASLERGICVVSRWSHVWDPLPGRVQLGGWSGLHWHSWGHSGSPSFKASQPDSPF